MKSIYKTILLCGLLAIAVTTPSSAQVISPVLDRNTFEFGYAYRWCHRDATPPPLDEIRWEVATLYVRFGAFDWLSVTFEGGLWNMENDDFPFQAFDRVVVGGGLTGRLWKREAWALSASLNYTEIWDDDVSAYGFDKRVYRIAAMTPISRRFFERAPTDLWVGPCYIDDTIENYRYNDTSPIRDEPETHWGLAGGVQTALWDHVALIGYAQYVDHVEGLLSLAFRVGGDE
jgi:opacity protein-like surface antigen